MLHLTTFLCMALLASPSTEAFEYFNAPIDYWSKKAEEKPPVETQDPLQITDKPPNEQQSQFDWKQQLDPTQDAFFKEGDYTPPAAFMELVRNPTDSNIRNWFKMMDLKNQMSTRLQTRIQEYLQHNQSTIAPATQEKLVEASRNVEPITVDPSAYRFRLYVDSKCPHCKRMLGTLAQLQDQGYYVEVRQVDDDRKSLENLPFPVERATPQELHEKDVQSVPLLFVGDLKKKVVYRVTGYQTADSIFASIRNQTAFH